jgi:hypothetical protein
MAEDADRATMQELADEIYYFLDKDEPKKAQFAGLFNRVRALNDA